ncbi:MAG: ASKHA domain-containing protein [Eubacteriales bacterium]|nr:ASKHA domain-containing protein [Eubacteriales bacterium]
MKLTFYPWEISVEVSEGMTVLEAERCAGLKPDSPCGGHGSCGKCQVTVDGKQVLACQTPAADGMRIYAEKQAEAVILPEGRTLSGVTTLQRNIHTVVESPRYLMAIDIGTTTLACQLLDGNNGEAMISEGLLNPQCSYGGDVVARIQAASRGMQEEMMFSVREGLSALIQEVCTKAGLGPEQVDVVSVVGNTCMQQLFMGISTRNLTVPPFIPELKSTGLLEASGYLPPLKKAKMLVIPDIAGYLGADTIAGVIAAGIHKKQELTLLVDIGTNGEMVLGNREKMIACATAAGPALEGAKISCGMRGAKGAIDHVWTENGRITYSVLGGGKAVGICGSGLIDLLAVLKKEKLIDRRGKLALSGQRPEYSQYLKSEGRGPKVVLAPDVSVSQDDIRELQLAKGAIAAGIELMMKECAVQAEDIREVYLAGAFGSFISKESACEIGLLPQSLLDKIKVAGNTAITGAAMIACDRELFKLTEKLSSEISSLELAVLPEFSKSFSKNMYF